MKKIMLKRIVILAVLGCAGIGPLAAHAETESREEAVLQEVQNLRALKDKDPQAYREMIRQKREQFRQRLEGLQGQDREGTRAFFEKEGEWRRRRLQYFKEKHPEAFESFRRQRINRLDRIAQKNPERFRQFMGNHPQFRERYEKYQGAARPRRGGVGQRREGGGSHPAGRRRGRS